MQSIELQAKSLDEAKAAAAEKLGVDPSQVSLSVLEETKGLFGKTNLRVRAEVVGAAPAAAPAEEKPKGGRAKKAEPKAEPKAEEKPKAAAKPAARGRGKAAVAEPVVEEAVTEAPEQEGDEEETEKVDIVATEADAKELKGIVDEILDLAGLSASVTQQSLTGRYVNLELDGKDVAFLVGKHGEVLNNFQYLVNVIANRKLNNGVRVTLDGNHYRTRREEALKNLAFSIAEQVRQRGEEAVLDALPAFERRIVHKVLAEFDGVSTYSEGEEPNRHVVIAPA
ncbi:MAG: KH domain-containing protein [Armatimonadetes bacterium]|nr:KH domain-containing protein [Armatimonadota bacterium]